MEKLYRLKKGILDKRFANPPSAIFEIQMPFEWWEDIGISNIDALEEVPQQIERLKKIIFNRIDDLCEDFVLHDRQNDGTLSTDDLNNAVKKTSLQLKK